MPDLTTKLTFTLVDGLSGPGRRMTSAFERMTTAAGRLESRSRLAGKGLDDLSKFGNLKRGSLETRKELEAVQKRVGQLAREMRGVENPSKVMTREFERAKSEAGALKQRLKEEETTLQSLRGRLNGAGVATNRMASETRRLRTEARLAKNDLRALSEAASRMDRARGKFQERLGMTTGLSFAGMEADRLGRASLEPMLGSISEASLFEDFEVEFKVLLGGDKLAKERLEELAAFGAETPFDLPEIARASRTLETLTKGALSTGRGLRLVGDVSAGTGQQIDELSTWFGRLYDGIMSGRPVGEAMMRLQEIGAVSGDTRSRIEEMVKSGEDGAKIWGELEKSFGRYSGMMEERSKTLSGQLSNMSDAWQIAKAAVGKSFVPMAKTVAAWSSRMALRLRAFAEDHPLITKALGLITFAFAGSMIAIGGLIKVAAGLFGAIAMVSFGLQAMGIQLSVATVRMRMLGLTSVFTTRGLRGMALAGIGSVRGLAVWIARLGPMLIGLASTALPAVAAGISTVSAAIFAIPGIGWIAAGLVLAAGLILAVWKPLKLFWSGFFDGFKAALAPVMPMLSDLMSKFSGVAIVAKWVVGVIGSAFNWVLNILAPGDAATSKWTRFGQLVGSVVGAFVRFLTIPLSLLNGLIDLIGDVGAMFSGWISPLEVVVRMLDRILGFFGMVKPLGKLFGYEPKDETVGKSAWTSKLGGVTRPAMAAAALIGPPAFAHGPVDDRPLPVLPAALAPVVAERPLVSPAPVLPPPRTGFAGLPRISDGVAPGKVAERQLSPKPMDVFVVGMAPGLGGFGAERAPVKSPFPFIEKLFAPAPAPERRVEPLNLPNRGQPIKPLVVERGGDTITISAPVTVYAAPGMNADELAALIKAEIEKAHREAARKIAAAKRGVLHDG